APPVPVKPAEAPLPFPRRPSLLAPPAVPTTPGPFEAPFRPVALNAAETLQVRSVAGTTDCELTDDFGPRAYATPAASKVTVPIAIACFVFIDSSPRQLGRCPRDARRDPLLARGASLVELRAQPV